MSINIRPTTESDFDAILNIVHNQYMHDYSVPYDAARLQAYWNRITLQSDTLLLEDDGNILAYATIEREEEETFIQLYNVSEMPQSALSDLLATAENESGASNFKTRISDKNTLQLTTAQNAGYAIYLSFLSMEHTIQNAPYPVSLSDGITIRNFIVGQDEAAVYQVDEAASLDKGYSSSMTFEQWSERMGLNKADFAPDLWFLACHENEIVGVALNATGNAGTWIDHLSVLRNWRKRGIGKALMQHSLNAFREHNFKIAKLNVDFGSLTNAPNLYRSVGFETVQQYHWLEKAI